MRAKVRLTAEELHARLGLPDDMRIAWGYVDLDPLAFCIGIEADHIEGGTGQPDVEAPYIRMPQSITVLAALQYARHDWERLPQWLRDAYEDGRVLFLRDSIEITTPDHSQAIQAGLGDMLIYRGQGDGSPAVLSTPAP